MYKLDNVPIFWIDTISDLCFIDESTIVTTQNDIASCE